MKRIWMVAALLTLIVSLSGCGETMPSEDLPGDDSANAAVTTEIPTETTEPVLYAPRSAQAYRWVNIEKVEQELKKAGFTKVERISIDDITSMSPIEDGAVESIEIDGNNSFEKDTHFSEESKVKVYFHNIPKLNPPLTPQQAQAFDYMNVGERYAKAGFICIQTEDIYDLKPGTDPQNEVMANGRKITSDAAIPFDSEIKIVGHFPYSEYTVKINVDFMGNLIFSKYGLNVTMDGKTLGELSHGQDGAYELKLREGSYTVIFTSQEDSEVQGEGKFQVSSDTEVNYEISCHSDHVRTELKSQKDLSSKTRITLPYGYGHYLRKDHEKVVEELKKQGFKRISAEETTKNIWKLSPVDSVVSVTIGGNENFERNETVSADAKVVVYYHVCDFKFEEQEVSVTEKENFEIPYAMTSEDSLGIISYVIDDEKIVQQNDEGGYTALVPGSTEIHAIAGGKVLSSCKVTVEEIIIPINKIILPSEELNLATGTTFRLDYTYEPAESNYTDVVIQISNSLIEQSEDGSYYSAQPGDSEISFMQDERVLAVCKVYAEDVAIEELTVGEIPAEILIGESADLNFTLQPENATNKGITAVSLKPNVAEISFDERGESVVHIKGLTAGEAEIVVKRPDGEEYKQTIVVKEILPEQLEITMKDPNTEIQVGTPIEFITKWTPEETSIKDLTWQSSNPNVIRFNEEGKPEAVGIGQATLTARHQSGKTATIALEVKPTPATEIKIGGGKMDEPFVKGKQLTFTATVLPENATDKTVTWSSSDTSVLTVNNQGVVTAVNEGEATITAACKNGVKTEFDCVVDPAPQKFSVTWSAYLVSNDHVGYNWSQHFAIGDGEHASGSTMTFDPGEKVSFALWIEENDSSPDSGGDGGEIEITEEVRKNGYSTEGEISVIEDGGRYSGCEAIWKYTIKMTPINW